jgi:hypothetical protein
LTPEDVYLEERMKILCSAAGKISIGAEIPLHPIVSDIVKYLKIYG